MEFDVHESLQLQLSELEMLISMFPNEGDLCVTDPGVVSEIQDFLSGKFELSDVQKLEYTIHLDLNGVKFPFQKLRQLLTVLNSFAE